MKPGRTKLAKRSVRVASRLRVRVERGPDAGLDLAPESGGEVTVGSSPDNLLVLTDPTVSRYHLELRHGPDGVAVRDLGSRNGTFVGDVRIERAVIPDGARLSLGSTTLAIEDGGEVALSPEETGDSIAGLVAESEAMQAVASRARKLARVGSSVLIEGETGVGKEVVARAVHEGGPRREKPFVVVDCGSMPATLIASQLFGHERGAFTGATEERSGAFERAQGGTILLDEIGELPLEVQPTLLGVLERRRFVRVGGSREIEVDVRVLAATNRDLRAEVNSGAFRADLYFRLAVARIVIPPLRERPEDIEPLVRHFVERLTGVEGENPLEGKLAELERHRYSGNVRELRNVVESAVVMGELDLGLAGAGEGRRPRAGGAANVTPAMPYRDARARALSSFEAQYLSELIEVCEGNASEAARRAKMDRPYLLTLLRRHGLR